MEMTPQKNDTDKFKYWIHFICGFIFGGMIGIFIVHRIFISSYSDTKFILVVGISAIICGLLAGHFNDRFWT